MKKTFAFLFAAFCAVFLFIGCQSFETDVQGPDPSGPSNELREVIITASIADDKQSTRTSYDEVETKNYWTPGDKIKIFSAGYAAEFTSINTVPEPVVNFQGMISFITGSSNDTDDTRDYVWGLYPYSEGAVYEEPDGFSRTARITTTFPAIQVGADGTFGDNLSVMIGRSESLSIPFRGAYSGAFFKVSRNDIESITLRGLNNEVLAGTATLGLNDNLTPVVHSVANPKTSVTVTAPRGTFEPGVNYYLITLPDVALPNGYSVTLRRSDGYEGTYELRANRPLNRIKFRNLSEPVDVRIENPDNIADGISTGWVKVDKPQDNELWYTTTDGNPLAYNTEYSSLTGNEVNSAESLLPISNNGVGIIRFRDQITEIDQSAFEGATTLKSLIMPSSIQSVRDLAFSGCSSLDNVSFSPNLKYIGNEAFSSCAFKELDLPEGLTDVGYNVFAFCQELVKVTLPESLSSPRLMMFGNCPMLREFHGAFASADNRCLIGPDNVLYAFAPSMLGSDDTYTIPEGVTLIANSAFRNAKIGGVILPDGLESIRDYGFYHCDNLKKVTIPSSVTEVSVGALSNCPSLESIEIKSESVPSGAFLMFENTGDCPIFVPANLLNDYKTTQHWSNYADRYFAAQGRNEIWLTLADGYEISELDLSPLDKNGFQAQAVYDGNRGVYVVSLGYDLTEIPSNAFYGATAIKSISIPEGVETIGDRAFMYCEHLSSVELPEGLTSLGSRAFEICPMLTSINIPSSLTSVGENPFLSCPNLRSFSGHNDLISQDGRCLIYNGYLVSFATGGLDGQSYTIPAMVTRIGSFSMQEATFQMVEIPDGVLEIGWAAFADCDQLSRVVISKSVVNIQGRAFAGCDQLSEIIMKRANPPYLADNAFEDTYENFSILVPSASVSAYESAWPYYASVIQAQ